MNRTSRLYLGAGVVVVVVVVVVVLLCIGGGMWWMRVANDAASNESGVTGGATEDVSSLTSDVSANEAESLEREDEGEGTEATPGSPGGGTSASLFVESSKRAAHQEASGRSEEASSSPVVTSPTLKEGQEEEGQSPPSSSETSALSRIVVQSNGQPIVGTTSVEAGRSAFWSVIGYDADGVSLGVLSEVVWTIPESVRATSDISERVDGTLVVTPFQATGGELFSVRSGAVSTAFSLAVELPSLNLPHESLALKTFADQDRRAIRDDYGFVDGSNTYVPPTLEERQRMRAVADALRDYVHVGRLMRSTEAFLQEVDALNYELLDITDPETNTTFFLLREQNENRKGWGWLALNQDSSSSLLLGAPHPIHDLRSTVVAADVVSRLGALGMVAAGADRDAIDEEVFVEDVDRSYPLSDTAHIRESIFHVFHESLFAYTDTYLQLHGFALRPERRDCFGQSFDLVVSPGDEVDSAVIDDIERESIAAGWEVMVYNANPSFDASCGLIGRKNVQGILARERGIDFVHHESETQWRRSDTVHIPADILLRALTDWR